MTLGTRALTAGDVDHVKWALYAALAWDPKQALPPFEVVIDHPEISRYHRDWGRPGDLGVLAERDGAIAGVAFCRLFTEDDHGHGYVDADTPEVAVAVAETERGRGLGTALLQELAEVARAAGVRRLSLSVDTNNPALGLYGRLGYRELARDDSGARMVLEL